MSQTQLLQEKVTEIVAELSKYESEMVDLKDSQPARGSGTKKVKLQKLITGAKRRLTYTEKKLKEAPASQPAPLDDLHSLDVSNVTQPAAADQVTPVQESNTDMVVDSITVNQATIPPNVSAGDAEELNLSSSVAGGGISSAVNALPIGPTPFPSPEAPNASLQDAMVVVPSEAAMGAPEALQSDVFASGFAAPSDPNAVQAIVSENHSTSFKRIDRSESESEDKEMDLTLITIEDKADLQQHLFKGRFVKGAWPVKKLRYVEVSENDKVDGDPDIFHDESEETSVTGVPVTQPTQQSSNISPTVEPESIAPHHQGTKSTATKGKGQDGDTKAQRKKELQSSKGKISEKGLRGGGRQMVVPIDGDSASEDTEDENKKGDYHASEFSVAKATRLNNDLAKRRERWANPEAHRAWAKAWLDAKGSDTRPPPPPGIELIRYDPNYLPDVATADYNLAIELLKNHSNNYLCIAHVMLNRKLVSHVDNLEGPTKIWGTALPRNQNPNAKTEICRPPNHFHCGCHEKVALAGFVMWKTWKAKCMIEGKLVEEGLHQHKAYSPREVLFFLQFLKSKFGYTVEDMFTGSFDEEEELRNQAAVMKKTSKFTARSHYNMIGQTFSLDEDLPEFEEEDLNMEWF